MQNNILHCKNCDSPLEQSHKFCPECGQKTKNELTIGVLFSNTISNYFSVDARFFASFLPLLFWPGYLPRKFVEGKRLKYLHPAQFYLFISVVFFFLLSFEARKQQVAFDETMKDGFELVDSSDTINVKEIDSLKLEKIKGTLDNENIYTGSAAFTTADIDTIIEKTSDKAIIDIGQGKNNLDSLIEINAPLEEKLKAIGFKEGSASWKKRFYIQALKFYEKRGGGLLKAFYDTIPIAMFFLLPIYALLLKLLFYKKGRFSHHLVFSFYYFSFLFTTFSIMLLANFIFPVPNWIDWLIILATGFYLVIAIKKFYGINFGKSFISTFALSFMYLLFVIPTSLVIVSIISFLIY